jgi:sugar fermentation stimulation protein A
VWLEESGNPNRKTKYDLIAVEKENPGGTLLVNMDSQAPNRVFGEWAAAGNFRSNLTLLRPETTYGNSRFDYYWETSEKRGFVEVKGVTLEDDGVCAFPDAPTERGVKHLKGLTQAAKDGYGAFVLFVVQMPDVKYLHPNDKTDPAFGKALREAARNGVTVLAMDCAVTEDEMHIRLPILVKL